MDYTCARERGVLLGEVVVLGVGGGSPGWVLLGGGAGS